MEQVSVQLQGVFILITLLTVFQFYRATAARKSFLLVVILWMLLQLILGLKGFYYLKETIPPRFILLVFPPLLLILMLFGTPGGRRYMDKLNTAELTLLHCVRLPVEIVLYFLFISKVIPELMTFKGYNFDVLMGLTAPFVYYFGYLKRKLSRTVLLIWNLTGLCLLLNIVVLAILSAPTPLQRIAFDQPNLAVSHFPFNWLPSVIVPLVLFSHLASIRQLLFKDK